MLFGKSYDKELKEKIATFKAKYGYVPCFDYEFDYEVIDDENTIVVEPKTKEMVRAYTEIAHRAVNVLYHIQDLKVAKLVWSEEYPFFEAAKDYVLLCSAAAMWGRKKGGAEKYIAGNKIDEWQNELSKINCNIYLFDLWDALGMGANMLQDDWANLYEREMEWF